MVNGFIQYSSHYIKNKKYEKQYYRVENLTHLKPHRMITVDAILRSETPHKNPY